MARSTTAAKSKAKASAAKKSKTKVSAARKSKTKAPAARKPKLQHDPDTIRVVPLYGTGDFLGVRLRRRSPRARPRLQNSPIGEGRCSPT